MPPAAGRQANQMPVKYWNLTGTESAGYAQIKLAGSLLPNGSKYIKWTCLLKRDKGLHFQIDSQTANVIQCVGLWLGYWGSFCSRRLINLNMYAPPIHEDLSPDDCKSNNNNTWRNVTWIIPPSKWGRVVSWFSSRSLLATWSRMHQLRAGAHCVSVTRQILPDTHT